jgi:hypothetical protein
MFTNHYTAQKLAEFQVRENLARAKQEQQLRKARKSGAPESNPRSLARYAAAVAATAVAVATL